MEVHVDDPPPPPPPPHTHTHTTLLLDGVAGDNNCFPWLWTSQHGAWVGAVFTYLGWNSISALGTASARWRLQQFRDTQKHIHHSIPQSTVPAPPYYNPQYNLILPFHCWRATLPAPCTNLPFPLSHSCVTTLI